MSQDDKKPEDKGEQEKPALKKADKPRKESAFGRRTHIDNAKAMHGVSKGMVAGAIALINQKDESKDRFTKSEVAKAIKAYSKQRS